MMLFIGNAIILKMAIFWNVMKDTPRTMIKSAVSFFSGTLLSRLTGLLRDIAMAFAFGTEASLAAFFVAFRFAHLLRRMLGESSLQTAFIPQFETLRKESSLVQESSDRSLRFFLDFYSALTLILLSVISLGLAVGGVLYRFYGDFWNIETTEIITLSALMFPSLLFICLAGLNTAFLNCEGCYFLPAAAPIAFNLLWIIGVLGLATLPAHEAMYQLSIWIVAACFFQWLVTLPKVVKLLVQKGMRFTHCVHINPFSKDLRILWKPFILGIIGISAAQINSAFDALFARYAESSGPAFLWYAIRLQQLPLALFGIALSGALLPPLTRKIKEGDLFLSNKLLEVAVYRSLQLILPITAALFFLGARCLDVLYGYGDFNSESINGTTQCLWGYLTGLIPMTLILIIAPVFYARGDYRTPTISSVVAMILNMALNALFVLKFHLSASSIAFATSLCAWVNLGYLIAFLEHPVRRAFLQGVQKTIQESGTVLLLICLIIWQASSSFPPGDSFFGKCFYLGILGFLFAIPLGSTYFFPFLKEKLNK